MYTEPSSHIVGDPTNFGGVATDTNYGPSNGGPWVHLTNTFNNVKVTGSVSLIVTQRANGLWQYRPRGGAV